MHNNKNTVLNSMVKALTRVSCYLRSEEEVDFELLNKKLLKEKKELKKIEEKLDYRITARDLILEAAESAFEELKGEKDKDRDKDRDKDLMGDLGRVCNTLNEQFAFYNHKVLRSKTKQKNTIEKIQKITNSLNSLKARHEQKKPSLPEFEAYGAAGKTGTLIKEYEKRNNEPVFSHNPNKNHPTTPLIFRRLEEAEAEVKKLAERDFF